jgi:acyl dehydratase
LAVDPTYVGREYPRTAPYEVARTVIAAFAEATGATHPAYTDPEAARALGHPDVIAPPTFAVVIAQAAESQYVADPAAGVDFSRVVHADERFVHHRPLHAGDRVQTVLHVESVVQRSSLTMVSTRCELFDADGDPVSTVWSTLAVRGEDS